MPIFSGAQWQEEREWAQTETQEVCAHKVWTEENSFCCDLLWQCMNAGTGYPEESWSLHPWRSTNLSGHGPGKCGKPALAAHALSKVVRMGDLQRCTPTSVILWLCDKQCWITEDLVWPRVLINDNLPKAFVHWSVWVSTSAGFLDEDVLFWASECNDLKYSHKSKALCVCARSCSLPAIFCTFSYPPTVFRILSSSPPV